MVEKEAPASVGKRLGQAAIDIGVMAGILVAWSAFRHQWPSPIQLWVFAAAACVAIALRLFWRSA